MQTTTEYKTPPTEEEQIAAEITLLCDRAAGYRVALMLRRLAMRCNTMIECAITADRQGKADEAKEYMDEIWRITQAVESIVEPLRKP